MNRVREPALAGLGLLVLCMAIALVAGGPVLFTRPFWLDEIHTVIAASPASPLSVVHEVTRLPDLAPPLLHLMEWAAGRLAGGLSPSVARGLSFGFVWLALSFAYLTLRRRFSVTSSLTGAMAVGSHALVIAHAFEARFYAPWLCFAAGFAWAVGTEDGRRSRTFAIAAMAIALCSIHWFGAISLVLMSGGALLAHGPPWRSGLRRLAPAAAGLAVVTLLSPMLFVQRSAISTPTWVADPSLAQIAAFSRVFYGGLAGLSLIALVIATLLPRSRQTVVERARSRLSNSGIGSLLALSLMPVAIVMLALVIQPAILSRYGITAVLAWAPLFAITHDLLGRAGRVALVAVLAGAWYVHARAEARSKQQFASIVAADRAAFGDVVNANIPIVFQSRHVLYPATAFDPRRDHARLLALSDATIDAMFPPATPVFALRRFFRFKREAAVVQERRFGYPRMATQASLDTTSRFVLVGTDASLPLGYKNVELFRQFVFPNHRAVRVRENLALFVRDLRTGR